MITSGECETLEFKSTLRVNLKTNKTKELVQFLHDNDLFNRKLTIVTSEVDNNLLLASRNVKYINVVKASSCSIVDLFDSDIILIDSDSNTLETFAMSDNEGNYKLSLKKNNKYTNLFPSGIWCQLGVYLDDFKYYRPKTTD